MMRPFRLPADPPSGKRHPALATTPFLLALVLATLTGTPALAETGKGVLLRASELKAKPFADAATVTTLPENSAVDILNAQGSWNEVQGNGQRGWIKLFNIRVTGESKTYSARETASLGNVFPTRSTSARSTTAGDSAVGQSMQSGGGEGVFNQNDISTAEAKPQEVRKLGQYQANAADARRRATSNQLQAREVPFLDPNDGKVGK